MIPEFILGLLPIFKSPKAIGIAIVVSILLTLGGMLWFANNKNENLSNDVRDLEILISQQQAKINLFEGSLVVTKEKLQDLQAMNQRLETNRKQNEIEKQQLIEKLNAFEFQRESKQNEEKAVEFLNDTYQDLLDCIENKGDTCTSVKLPLSD